MAKIKITVTHSPAGAEEDVLILGGIPAKKLGLVTGTAVTLRFGSAERRMRLRVEPKSNAFRLHPAVGAAMALPGGTPLCVRHQAAEHTLVLGPLLGVLLRKIGSNPERPFGSVTGFCRELTEAGKKLGTAVFFFAADRLPVGPSATISGWTYSKGGWHAASFPYPDAVYNRITSRVIENSPPVQQFFRTFKARTGGMLFNERYLDKAEVFQALKKETSVGVYLPESYLYRNPLMLKKMLGKHSVIFLKPILSSLGKGIIRVGRSPSGYVCHIAGANGAVNQATFAGQPALIKHLSARMAGRRYLIQEGIDLIKIDGNSADFRSLVQRGETGAWEVTSIVGRVSAGHTFVSNLARGGRLATVRETIGHSNLPPSLQEAAMARLRKASLDIAEALEKQIDAHFAELGIDLAVDTRGRVLLLEINSKPSKEDNTPLGAEEKNPPTAKETPVKVRPSVKRVVQYVRYLGKF
ncbi:YheC/YheD family endospore coat-associated protein [Gorillibacterium sp. sgz500922]|uniref:YheC/YheD family endospore coat-associated protein n=1 Tax=Gorillibacterium sp. sgz500922 TaxID=3446694 RepID=UPI003F666004